jgi:hypothetical protein
LQGGGCGKSGEAGSDHSHAKRFERRDRNRVCHQVQGQMTGQPRTVGFGPASSLEPGKTGTELPMQTS